MKKFLDKFRYKFLWSLKYNAKMFWRKHFVSTKRMKKNVKEIEKTQVITNMAAHDIKHIDEINVLKRDILKKHMTLSNINVIFKLLMILFTFGCLIFFAIVSSEGITSDKNIRHLIGIGHMVFIWPTITCGVVLVIETMLFVIAYYKRKWINWSSNEDKPVGFIRIRRLTYWTMAFYTLSLIFIIFMFSYWFTIIDGSFGNYHEAFSKTFNFYIPEIGDFRTIFIVLFSVMITIEVSIIISLIAIQSANHKHWIKIKKLFTKAQITAMKRYKY